MMQVKTDATDAELTRFSANPYKIMLLPKRAARRSPLLWRFIGLGDRHI